MMSDNNIKPGDVYVFNDKAGDSEGRIIVTVLSVASHGSGVRSPDVGPNEMDFKSSWPEMWTLNVCVNAVTKIDKYHIVAPLRFVVFPKSKWRLVEN